MERVDVSILRCPVTGSSIRDVGNGTLVSAENRTYPISDGVPVMIDQETSLFAGNGGRLQGRPGPTRGAVKRLVERLTPSPTRSIGARERFTKLSDLIVDSAGTDQRTLVIGGGSLGRGMDVLVERLGSGLLETDVYVGPRTAVVCDAHQLPFGPESFDAVIAQAVLEHVMDPYQVVSEIHRVLRPRGLVYAETPFMQQVHEGAYDITRFTMIGHRRLFRWFDQVDAGIACGPATAFLWATRYLVRSAPRRSRLAREILDRAVCLCFFWIKYLDDILITRPGAVDGASGFYFLGRKRDAPISDDEVIAGYNGGFRRRAIR